MQGKHRAHHNSSSPVSWIAVFCWIYYLLKDADLLNLSFIPENLKHMMAESATFIIFTIKKQPFDKWI